MTLNYEEKLSVEIITGNYEEKLSASILRRGKFGNYRDTAVSKNNYDSFTPLIMNSI